MMDSRDVLILAPAGVVSATRSTARSFSVVLCLFLTLAVVSSVRAQTPSASPELKELLGKVFDELGGQERIRSVNAFRIRERLESKYETDALILCPDRLHAETRIEKYIFIEVLSPTIAYRQVGGLNLGNYKPQERQDLLDSYCWESVASVLLAAKRAGDPASSFSLSGSEHIGSVDARIIDVSVAGFRARWFVDPESGRVLRQAWTDSRGRSTVEDYSDWRAVDDLTIPFEVRVTRDGKVASNRVLAIETNPSADPRLFGEPPVLMEPMTPAPVTPAVSRAVLKISSQPGGAQVFLNDAPRGSTDAQGSLVLRPPAGTYVLKLTLPGYKDWTQPVTLAARETTSIEAKLTPPTAILRISTQPGGAQVYLNDEFRGTSSSDGSLSVSSLQPGSYRLRLTVIGYKEWNQTLNLAAGDNQAVEAKLEPSGPKPLELRDVEEALQGGVSPRRVTELVKQFGVDFALTDEAEQRLRFLGADSDLLLAISRNKK